MVAIRGGEHYVARSNFKLNGVPKKLGRNGSVPGRSIFLPHPLFTVPTFSLRQPRHRKSVVVGGNGGHELLGGKRVELTRHRSTIGLDKRTKWFSGRVWETTGSLISCKWHHDIPTFCDVVGQHTVHCEMVKKSTRLDVESVYWKIKRPPSGRFTRVQRSVEIGRAVNPGRESYFLAHFINPWTFQVSEGSRSIC